VLISVVVVIRAGLLLGAARNTLVINVCVRLCVVVVEVIVEVLVVVVAVVVVVVQRSTSA
jgi:hypothetical protein